MAMERSWSGDSLVSSLLEPPSYIATFDASQPRQHRRRGPIAATEAAVRTGYPTVAIPASSSPQGRERKRRNHPEISPLPSRRRDSDHSLRQSLTHQPIPAPSVNFSSSASDGTASPAKRLRLSHTLTTDNHVDSSAYAADPSSEDMASQRQTLESSSDDTSSNRGPSMWGRQIDGQNSVSHLQTARSLLVSAPRQWHKSDAREPSPSGRPKNTLLQTSNEAETRRTSSRSRLGTVLQSHCSTDRASARRSPNHQDSAALGEEDTKGHGRSALSVPGRILPKPAPPGRATVASKGINAHAESAIIICTGLWACWQLGHRAEKMAQIKAGELAVVIALATAYSSFARGPGLIWSTDVRTFRTSSDDGATCGLLLGPLLAATMLITSLEEDSNAPIPSAYLRNGRSLANPPWFVEGPLPILGEGTADRLSSLPVSALSLARCTLLSLQTMIGLIFFAHLCATRLSRGCSLTATQSNWHRLGSFTAISLTITIALYILREAFEHFGLPLWTGLARWELICASVMFQTNMYAISRLGRRSFTLGELGIVAALGVTLMVEAVNLTLAKLLPHTTLYVKTFRRATPLLIFQLALIVGTFFVGFLLSPLLYLSRHLAQKPLHRLRWPHKRDLHRRLLAGFFFFFAAVFVVGALGNWVRWLLGRRDPWVWTLRFILLGKHWWTRPALILYWLSCIIGSIAGWQAVVSRAKRFRAASSTVTKAFVSASTQGGRPGCAHAAASTVPSTQRELALSSAKGKKATHLSLNARRKFFHALAVAMYVPAIALDPAFTHLAFSLAFSVFTFAEYIRYYALYPFGAAFHIFMSEFTDHKDSGPVILSHFYLLTGCCGGLWLEAHQQIMHQTGVLVLGIGDALASIIGRKYGRLHWPASSKTIEGSAAFLFSVVLGAWFLRLVGWCEHFDLLRYSGVVSLLCLIEGVSEQNDNLILPIFSFIYLCLAHV